MDQPRPGTSHRRHERKRSTHHSGKPNPYRRVETIITKHFLRIAGVILILAVVGYSVSSLDKLRVIVKQIVSHEQVSPRLSQNPQAAGAGMVQPAVAAAADYSQSDIRIMAVLCAATCMIFALILLFSIRIRRKEIPRIAIVVFYAVVFLLARKYGWQIHLLFPMILVFSALIFYSGVRLHSMVAGKWNYLVCWLSFMIWWAMKMILGRNAGLLPGFFIYGSLFYLLFLFTGAYGGFRGHHKYSEYAEIGLTILNGMLFYMMGLFGLARFGLMDYAWVFSLALAAANLGILFVFAAAGKRPEPGPYVFPAFIMLSLIFPFIFNAGAILLFLAVLSSLLLFYSKYSGDRIAVITALGSIVMMLLMYFKDLVFQYLPAAFLGNVLANKAMMMKGLVAGLVIFPVMIINSRLIRKLHVGFSKEWFSRRSYQSFFKGINLIVLYLSGFWVVNYIVLVWSKNPDLNYMSWFGYNCLFFIITIPLLSVQKSKFVIPAIGFALFFSLAYPTLIHFTNVEMRNDALQHEQISKLAFWFHYPVAVLFIAEIFILEVFIRNAMEKNSLLVMIFTAYLMLAGLFILLSEYDHFSIWTGLRRGVTIEEIALADRVIPYTIILLLYTAVILGVGMTTRNRLFRAAGLILLSATVVKMLYIDVRTLSGMTRSVVLFTVGLIVFVLSFMYPRLKRYFRQREHDSKGIVKRSHHRSRRKPSTVPMQQITPAKDETL